MYRRQVRTRRMNRPQVAYFLSGVLAYFPTGARRYAPACSNEWVRGICEKPRIKCAECQHRRFLPVTDDVIRWHLSGEDEHRQPFVAGVYPLLLDESCYFLAADFDKAHWQDDAMAFLLTCRRLDLDAALERSRSGQGGHVWIFFEQAISAALARRLGAHLLTETMEERPDIGLDSYDRLFPNQDTLPQGGFGNLIALPLQKGPRDRGHSVFLDEHFDHGPTSGHFWHASARSDARRSNTSFKRPNVAVGFSAFDCRLKKTVKTNRGPCHRLVTGESPTSPATSLRRWNWSSAIKSI